MDAIKSKEKKSDRGIIAPFRNGCTFANRRDLLHLRFIDKSAWAAAALALQSLSLYLAPPRHWCEWSSVWAPRSRKSSPSRTSGRVFYLAWRWRLAAWFSASQHRRHRLPPSPPSSSSSCATCLLPSPPRTVWRGVSQRADRDEWPIVRRWSATPCARPLEGRATRETPLFPPCSRETFARYTPVPRNYLILRLIFDVTRRKFRAQSFRVCQTWRAQLRLDVLSIAYANPEIRFEVFISILYICYTIKYLTFKYSHFLQMYSWNLFRGGSYHIEYIITFCYLTIANLRNF